MLIVVRLDEIVFGALFKDMVLVDAFEDLKENTEEQEIMVVGSIVLDEYKKCNSRIMCRSLELLVTHLFKLVLDVVLLDMFFRMFMLSIN